MLELSTVWIVFGGVVPVLADNTVILFEFPSLK
jgi:hypothetical protein